MKLDHEDVELLMEALDSHLSKAQQTRAMASMLGAVLIRDDKGREEFEKHEKVREAEDARKQRVVSDKVVLLKAKLISLRSDLDGEAADKVLEESSR